jgi:AraC-like DNA-binding protein
MKQEEKQEKLLRGFSIEAYYDRRNDNFKAHSHTCFEILIIIRGKRNVRINGKEFLAKDGDIVVFFPGEVHEEKTLSETISYLGLRFWDYDLKQLKVDFPDLPPSFHIFNVSRQTELMNVLNKIMAENKSGLPGADTLKGAYFVEFVVFLRRAFLDAMKGASEKNAGAKERISSAVELMKKTLDNPLNLSELAKSSFLSASYFSQVFKERTGKSPRQFIIKEKIEKAKKLLLETDKSIKQISDELGYEAEPYFFRQFKQKTGATPMDFRNSKKVK